MDVLILGRKENESIICTTETGQQIKIKVIDVRRRNGYVRIGIDADESVTIHREEVQKEIDRKGSTRAQPEPIRQLPENPERTL